MQVTSKGQVTIPQEIRNRLGLLPHTKVAFELAGDHARIRKAEAGDSTRGRMALDALRGTADVRMNTDEIMALTRGKARPSKEAGMPLIKGKKQSASQVNGCAVCRKRLGRRSSPEEARH